jgi:hypothetical protein
MISRMLKRDEKPLADARGSITVGLFAGTYRATTVREWTRRTPFQHPASGDCSHRQACLKAGSPTRLSAPLGSEVR